MMLRYCSFFLLILAWPISSCKVYSFTGASIDPRVKTVFIAPFNNQSQNGNTAITQDLTDRLKNRFVSQTTLRITDQDADLEFKGTLIGYEVRGQAPTANQLTALNRLTLTVRVEYFNRVIEESSWTETFSRFADFPSTENLITLEERLLQDINRQLVDDIFNKAVINW